MENVYFVWHEQLKRLLHNIHEHCSFRIKKIETFNTLKNFQYELIITTTKSVSRGLWLTSENARLEHKCTRDFDCRLSSSPTIDKKEPGSTSASLVILQENLSLEDRMACLSLWPMMKIKKTHIVRVRSFLGWFYALMELKHDSQRVGRRRLLVEPANWRGYGGRIG